MDYFECQKQRVILECKEKEIKSLEKTQNSNELRTFLCDSGSQTELPVQAIATSTPCSQTPVLRMSETNEPRVKFNLTNSDQTFETTHVSETQSELESLRELRHNSPTTYEVISDSFVKNLDNKINPKTPEFSREILDVNESSITSQNSRKHKKTQIFFSGREQSVDEYLIIL